MLVNKKNLSIILTSLKLRIVCLFKMLVFLVSELVLFIFVSTSPEQNDKNQQKQIQIIIKQVFN